MICWRIRWASLWLMLPYLISPTISSNESRSLDRTRRRDVQPDPGRPSTNSCAMKISDYIHLSHAKQNVPFHPDLPGPRCPSKLSSGLSVCIARKHDLRIRTLLGLWLLLNSPLNWRGSTSDHNVLPNAASGAITRTERLRKVTVNRF